MKRNYADKLKPLIKKKKKNSYNVTLGMCGMFRMFYLVFMYILFVRIGSDHLIE